MFLCICNALRERTVREVAPYCRTPAELYRALDCRPQCGRCATALRSVLDQSRLDGLAAEPSACGQSPLALAAE